MATVLVGLVHAASEGSRHSGTMSQPDRPAAQNALSSRLYSYGMQPPKSLKTV